MAETELTGVDSLKSMIEYAYSDTVSAINHAIDYAQPYIKSHPINMYTDSQAFRDAVSALSTGVREEVVSRINDAMYGFNTRVNNIANDIGSINPTEDDVAAFSSLVEERGASLGELSSSVVAKCDELVTTHATDRPLMQATGDRSISSPFSFTSPNTFKYTFRNVGSKPWSGWMVIKLVDQYKKSVSVDFAPPSIPIVGPGESVVLTREISVPRTQYVNGEPRTWGDKTTVYVSLRTRLT